MIAAVAEKWLNILWWSQHFSSFFSFILSILSTANRNWWMEICSRKKKLMVNSQRNGCNEHDIQFSIPKPVHSFILLFSFFLQFFFFRPKFPLSDDVLLLMKTQFSHYSNYLEKMHLNCKRFLSCKNEFFSIIFFHCQSLAWFPLKYSSGFTILFFALVSHRESFIIILRTHLCFAYICQSSR